MPKAEEKVLTFLDHNWEIVIIHLNRRNKLVSCSKVIEYSHLGMPFSLTLLKYKFVGVWHWWHLVAIMCNFNFPKVIFKFTFSTNIKSGKIVLIEPRAVRTEKFGCYSLILEPQTVNTVRL